MKLKQSFCSTVHQQPDFDSNKILKEDADFDVISSNPSSANIKVNSVHQDSLASGRTPNLKRKKESDKVKQRCRLKSVYNLNITQKLKSLYSHIQSIISESLTDIW